MNSPNIQGGEVGVRVRLAVVNFVLNFSLGQLCFIDSLVGDSVSLVSSELYVKYEMSCFFELTGFLHCNAPAH